MKKVVLCLLLVGILLLVASCDDNNDIDVSELKSPRYVMITMPDNSILKGKCTHFLRLSDHWAYIEVDGTEYRMETWRIVMWEK